MIRGVFITLDVYIKHYKGHKQSHTHRYTHPLKKQKYGANPTESKQKKGNNKDERKKTCNTRLDHVA